MVLVGLPQNELALIAYTKMLVLRWGFAWYCSNFVWYSASKDRRNVIKILVKQKDAILVLPDWPQNFITATSKFHNWSQSFHTILVYYDTNMLLVYFVITEGSWIKIRVKSLQVSNWKTKPAVQTKSKGCEDSSRGAAASEASCRAPRTRRPAKIPSILFSKNTERCITWILRVYFHRSTPLSTLTPNRTVILTWLWFYWVNSFKHTYNRGKDTKAPFSHCLFSPTITVVY